jgi:hypothetical protein
MKRNIYGYPVLCRKMEWKDYSLIERGCALFMLCSPIVYLVLIILINIFGGK